MPRQGSSIPLPAFFGATHVYRPIYRGGIVYNYGMPRDRVVQITRRPIYVQKIYKTNNWKGGHFDRDDRNKGIKIYAPRFSKDGRPNRGPKKFADNPNDFRPKAKLRDTYKGDVPKGWGPSARGVKSIAKEDPDAFKKKHDFDGRDFGDRGKNNDRDNDRNNDKGQASKDFDRDNRDKDTKKGFGSQGGPDQFKQGNREQGDGGRGDKGKPKGSERPPIEKVIREQGAPIDQNANGGGDKKKNFGSQGGPDRFKQGNREDDQGGGGKQKNFGAPGGPGGPDQFKQGNRDNFDQGGGGEGKKKKHFGEPGGPGGPNQFKQGNRDQDDQGGGGQRKQKDFGGGGPGGPGGPGGIKQFNQGGGQAQGDQGGGGGGEDKKCQKHPEKPECQGRN